jgi:catechol 2,3-dioxygenase-like lactoylglutathione lyase family enzyme
MRPQTMITVRDVEASSAWYEDVLGLESAHGGPEYEQLAHDGHVLVQLHRWEPHEHPALGSPDIPAGNGVALWFETDAFDAAVARAHRADAEVVQHAGLNPRAHHREIWLRDPDGYVVVLSSPFGDVGDTSEDRGDDALDADAG